MDNPELIKAWNIIANTDTHLFLTGKAGTGKTTFLKELRDMLPKRMVVLAPTGIAAINAQGTTIHSFFQLGFGPQIPGMQQKNKKFQFRKKKIQLIRSLDLVVIDEISMVRADMLDAIDRVLRQYRDHNLPFGGVQLLMIGDMQQLAPVAKEDEWRLLSQYYDSPYFFSSKALQNTDFVTVELKHVYRQSNPEFLELLNKVRTNTVDEKTLNKLNERYIPGFVPRRQDGYICITTHVRQADEINRDELDKLKTTPCKFEAKIDGDFPESSYPTDMNLVLKVGAQVMFVKNDSSFEKKYYNGMMGEISEINDENLLVRSYDTNDEIKVEREQWENTKYELDSKTGDVKEEVIGTFLQFPIKAAWAITVHKSQGLTFERAIIDVQHSFAHGQTYVALSRCKTLEGMVLSSPIPVSAIINDQVVDAFSHDPRHQEPDQQRLEMMQRQYFLRIVDGLFSFMVLRQSVDSMVRLLREFFYDSYSDIYKAWLSSAEKLKEIDGVSSRFHVQYMNILMNIAEYATSEQLQDRLRKGAAYFKGEISFFHKQLSDLAKIKVNNKQVAERMENIFSNAKDEYEKKMQLFDFVANNGFILKEFLIKRAKCSLALDEPKTTERKHSNKANVSEWKKKYSALMSKVSLREVDTDDSKLPY